MITARTFFSFLGAMLVGILSVFVVSGPIAARVAAYFIVTENTSIIAMVVIAVILAFLAFRFAGTLMNGEGDEIAETR